MATIIDEIGIALAAEATRRHLAFFPVGPLLAHVPDWTAKAAAIRFELLPCPANPTASWGTIEVCAKVWEPLTLSYVDITTTRDVGETSFSRSEHDGPWTHINSNFDTERCERYWAQDALGSRAPGLYLPLPGLAHMWPKLREATNAPNVTVWLSYGGANVLLASRFSEKAQAQHYLQHNVDLLALPTPVEWTMGKQFGDERKGRKKKTRAVRGRTKRMYRKDVSDIPDLVHD